jgi:PTH1 family peptidyl-tRNA hydrolase
MSLLVFGLGNPGKRYELTLHNAGFEATDRMAAFLGGKTRKRCLRRYRSFSLDKDAVISVDGDSVSLPQDVLVVQPLTYMNHSGNISRYFQLDGKMVAVVCDNMDLDLGMVRIRKVQSLSTHKGIRSLQENLPGVEFVGVFVGIGRPAEGVSVPDHVLSRLADPLKEALFIQGVEKAASALEELALGRDVTEVQLEFNKTKKQ